MSILAFECTWLSQSLTSLLCRFASLSPSLLSLSLKELLPSDYRKVRGIEQRVITEYSKLTGLSEHNARYRYVDLFRSLKTFGVTFFLVKV